ncbi:MAG: hypothetical protein ACSHYF_10050 [Verrucomicrobiaceae bacterium]
MNIGIRLVIAMALVSPLMGELSPRSYRGLQVGAPEKISIKVVEVKHQNFFRKLEMVRAKVTAVSKSATKLKVGDEIEIRYRRVFLKGPGPAPIPELKKGELCPAWLRKNEEGFYEPAARARSFVELIKP